MPRCDGRSSGSTYVAWGLSILSIINMHCLYNLVAIQANDLISGIRNYYCTVVLRTTGGMIMISGVFPITNPWTGTWTSISGTKTRHLWSRGHERDKACPRFPPVQS